MAENDEQFEPMNVRAMWQNEALDFTPWLAENIRLLGKTIGKNLKEDPLTEVRVGPLRLDILAEDADTGDKVAVENQLDWTNTHHLGQLVTYATGCNARVSVWVATEFRHEYAEALHQLNVWTRDEFEFFGVKIDVSKRPGDPNLSPRFQKVVYPGGWDKGLTLQRDAPMEPRVQMYHDFYRPLISALTEAGFADSARQIWGSPGRLFSSQFGGDTGYAGYFGDNENKVWVVFHYRGRDKEEASLVFNKLSRFRTRIEESIGALPSEKWVWNEYKRYSFFTLSLERQGSIEDSPQKLGEFRNWMRQRLEEFKNSIEPLVEEIHIELELSD